MTKDTDTTSNLHRAAKVYARECQDGQLMDLSRICAAPSARLSHLPFKSDRTFPSQC
jgi:hypothetical protein